jgi:hypothetical protein
MVYFGHLLENGRILATFFHRQTLCIDFDPKWVGLYFGRFFHKLTGPPCLGQNLNLFRSKCEGRAQLFLRLET